MLVYQMLMYNIDSKSNEVNLVLVDMIPMLIKMIKKMIHTTMSAILVNRNKNSATDILMA